jgi:hypothetical protein
MGETRIAIAGDTMIANATKTSNIARLLRRMDAAKFMKCAPGTKIQ